MAASQAVYHALKAPTDPPRVDGPLKIQIASAAWEDKSFYMPNKGEFIAEFVLTKLLKDKANAPALNPVLDARFWTLLSHIISETKSTKHWLLPLLNKLPVAPILSAFFQLLNDLESELRVSLASAVDTAVAIIWPLAVQKINAEVLLESFGTFLASAKYVRQPNVGLEHIAATLTSSLRVAATNSSNKKKLSFLFIQNHLHKWIAAASDCGSSGLQEELYVVGTEILFNVDTLRQPYDENHPLFTALQSIPDALTRPFLPRLFSSFVHSTRKHRGALHGQNEANLTFFDSCQVLLTAAAPTSSTWETRAALLRVVAEENIFGSGQEPSLKSIVPLALFALDSGDAEQASLSVSCLCKLLQIDHELVLSDVPRILTELCRHPAPPPSVFDFLQLILDYHVKTRTMHEHVETLFAALVSSPRETSDTPEEYRRLSSSALLSTAYLEKLALSNRRFLTPTQAGRTVKFILETLQSCWKEFQDAESGRSSLAFSSTQLWQEINDSINDMRNDFLSRALTKSLKASRKSESWGPQIVATAILRLEYALDAPYSEKLWSKIEGASEDENILPELKVELFRILVKWSAVDQDARSTQALERLLTYLENSGSLQVSWSGGSLSSGSQGRAEGALATLHMIVDRWLPTIDALASEAQLRRLVSILVRFNVGECDPDPLHADGASILLTALSSAQFWELPNLRTAVLSYADDATSMLVDEDAALTTSDGAAVSLTYQLLLMLPIEYMPRSTRSELVKRAINADVLSSSLDGGNLTIRLFIHNAAMHTGYVDQPVANLSRYLRHLVQQDLSSQAPGDHTTVTLSLFELHLSYDILVLTFPDGLFMIRALLKSSEQDSVQAILGVLRSCVPSDLRGSANASSVLVCLVDSLTKGFAPTNLLKDVQDEIFNLQRRLSQTLASHIQDVGQSKELMSLWLHTLSLGRWLQLSGQSGVVPFIGRQICAQASSSTSSDHTAAFAILAEELQCIPESDRFQHLDSILATYVLFCRLVSPDGQTRLDRLLSQTCNLLSVAEFSHALDLTCECLSDTTHSAQDMPHLVHMAALLLFDHPTSTLKVTQKFLTNCLNIFAGRSQFTDGPLSLRLEVLRLLRQQCSDSPASLRAADMGSLWSILSKFLARSKVHDAETSPTAFYEIIAITSALIRLRRDLITPTLPSLALVIQQLIATLRRPRPQLGVKQTVLVTDSLPRWVNCKSAVGSDQGKALARLLEALITKTTIRSNTSTAELQRAESLARPFSKHAAYVIKAYIDAMNDPLCILPSELRKELRPGLFALCNMLSDHSRDAMMVSALDAGGKTIMKNLWTEYEKQKYVGKG
ncbi:Urb2/Npa2 family-domain-containing protein [Roridomyces roridus]|uniref:Urb2/Npa2 family-domain-containing protein n=1 Tax=Roridomyces roridus TaxID=1738132 RepID=A0AAD7FL53_9AGAR|nr:Urb2/Npa2 family-domain-containing protein [Roridomyces roridus]